MIKPNSPFIPNSEMPIPDRMIPKGIPADLQREIARIPEEHANRIKILKEMSSTVENQEVRNNRMSEETVTSIEEKLKADAAENANQDESVQVDPNEIPYMLQNILKANESLNVKLFAAQARIQYYADYITKVREDHEKLSAELIELKNQIAAANTKEPNDPDAHDSPIIDPRHS